MPIRRPRGPKPTLRHVSFLELMASAPETAIVHRGAHASFLTLRLLEQWIALGADLVTDESSARLAARDAITRAAEDEELSTALRSIVDAMVALQEPDAQPVLPRVYALGKLHEQRGLMPQAAEIYGAVARYVDASVHLDLAYDAHMRRAFCLRTAGEFEWADQGYATAGALAARARDRVRVLTSRVGQAKVDMFKGNLPAAATALEAIQAEAEKLAATRLVANVLHDRSALARMREDIPGALRLAFESFRRTTTEYDRERVLLDLALLLMLYGDDRTAQTAFQLIELGTSSETARNSARIGLLELAYRATNEPVFESYRRQLAEAQLHAMSRTSFLLDAGKGLAVFGRFDEARSSLRAALELAESTGQSQRLFQIEAALEAVDVAEREKRRAEIEIRPEPRPAPDEISRVLEELLADVAAAA